MRTISHGMHRYRLATIVAATALSVIAPPVASGEQHFRAPSECEALVRYLGGSDIETERCRRDLDYRKHLATLGDEALSRDLTETHNRDRIVMLPAGGFGGYVRISSLADLPLQDVVNLAGEHAAESHIGQRYVIRGILGTLPDDTGGVSVTLYSIASNEAQKFLLLSADALNEYQKAFLGRHCWANEGGRTSSMCRGDVYVSVKRDPSGVQVVQTLDGAVFSPASDTAVLGSIAGP